MRYTKITKLCMTYKQLHNIKKQKQKVRVHGTVFKVRFFQKSIYEKHWNLIYFIQTFG